MNQDLIQKLASNLEHSLEAQEYLHRRGITDETIEYFQLGYETSPSSKLYKRIVFPFFDIYGNIVGYAGRAVSPDIEPKYWNSPGISKDALYGLHQCVNMLYSNYPCGCVIVEGQMDVLSLAQVGIPAIALFGKSMSEGQMLLLRRWTDKVILFVDSDVSRSDTYKLADSILYNEYFENCPIVHAENYGGKDANEILMRKGDDFLYSIFEKSI